MTDRLTDIIRDAMDNVCLIVPTLDDYAAAAAKAVREAMGWQPIETAPRDGTRFLAYEKRDGYGVYECWYQHDFSNWCGWQDDWDSEPEPTNWMLLPDAPDAAGWGG